MITRPSKRTLSLNPWLLHSVLSRFAGQSHDTIGLMPILCRELSLGMPPQYFFSREQVLTTTNTSQRRVLCVTASRLSTTETEPHYADLHVRPTKAAWLATRQGFAGR
jgi:hypothetical protein